MAGIPQPYQHGLERKGDNFFESLDLALAAYPDHAKIFLTPDAPITFDEYAHPADNVMYCIGSDNVDLDGKTDAELDVLGTRLRLAYLSQRTLFAGTVLPIVCVQRWLMMEGK